MAQLAATTRTRQTKEMEESFTYWQEFVTNSDLNPKMNLAMFKKNLK